MQTRSSIIFVLMCFSVVADGVEQTGHKTPFRRVQELIELGQRSQQPTNQQPRATAKIEVEEQSEEQEQKEGVGQKAETQPASNHTQPASNDMQSAIHRTQPPINQQQELEEDGTQSATNHKDQHTQNEQEETIDEEQETQQRAKATEQEDTIEEESKTQGEVEMQWKTNVELELEAEEAYHPSQKHDDIDEADFERETHGNHEVDMAWLLKEIKTTGHKGPKKFGGKRSALRYYDELFWVVLEFAHDAESILDVGSGPDPFLKHFDFVPERHIVAPYFAYVSSNQALKKVQELDGIKVSQVDFLDFEPPKRFDVVLCSQVLEHVEKPAAFLRKLFETGYIVIVSVPYNWNSCKDCHHVSNWIKEETMKRWVEADLTASKVRRPVRLLSSRKVYDKMSGTRLIQVYETASHLHGYQDKDKKRSDDLS